MKAIQVKYLGATNHRGVRLKATAYGAEPMVVSREYDNNIEEQAKNLAYLFCQRQGWVGTLVPGQLPNGDHVFCFKTEGV